VPHKPVETRDTILLGMDTQVSSVGSIVEFKWVLKRNKVDAGGNG
jgi:hypothetical protein